MSCWLYVNIIMTITLLLLLLAHAAVRVKMSCQKKDQHPGRETPARQSLGFSEGPSQVLLFVVDLARSRSSSEPAMFSVNVISSKVVIVVPRRQGDFESDNSQMAEGRENAGLNSQPMAGL